MSYFMVRSQEDVSLTHILIKPMQKVIRLKNTGSISDIFLHLITVVFHYMPL